MKKFLSITLFAAMILSLCAFSVSAAWDGTSVSASLKGEGTQESPYLVESAEDLAFLAKSVNEGNSYEGKYIVQTADIDLGGKAWTPIGQQKVNSVETDAPFSGVYSGLGHKVIGLSITGTTDRHSGLFGYIMSGEVEAGIANLTVDGAITLDGATASNFGVGGVVGSAAKDTSSFKANVVLANCISNVSVTLTNCTGEPRVGGLAGYVFNGKVENCVSNGNVNVAITAAKQGRVGGLVGQTNRTHFIGCVNNGNVTCDLGTIAANSRAGGIAAVITRGGVKGDEANATYTIFENCINNGAISGKGGSNVWVAGIGADFYVGGNWPNKDCRVKFINCINNGAIASETSNSGNFPHAGGIAGYTQNGYTEFEFIGCINTGEISSTGGKEVRAGGIVGSVYSAKATFVFDKCLSTGSLNSGCFSLANKAEAMATSTANADAATIKAATDAVKALMKESTTAIAGFDPSKGLPEPPETTEPPVVTDPPATDPPATDPVEPPVTGDSSVVFIIVALVSVVGIALIAKRREN